MIVLITLGYILPALAVFILCYLDKDVVTVRDLLNWSWTYLIPMINIYVILILIINSIVDSIKIKINKDWWNNFLDKRL